LKLLKKFSFIFLKFLRPKFLGVENFEHFVISIPKCIELNSKTKSILISGFGLGVTEEPENVSFLGEIENENFQN